jgi:flavin reductase (DIM6/NTAB) family NADH-FMN oxidoreductase RutF
VSGLDQARFREVLGHFATGITIVTALEEGVPVGFTCQSFAALSLDPPMVLLAPARSSTSWPRIAKAGAFCVNILEEHQEALCRAFAVPGGDKFDGVAWTPGITGAPVIEGSLAVVECRLGQIFDGGDHELVIGHVEATDIREGGPLLFYRSGFGRFDP